MRYIIDQEQLRTFTDEVTKLLHQAESEYIMGIDTTVSDGEMHGLNLSRREIDAEAGKFIFPKELELILGQLPPAPEPRETDPALLSSLSQTEIIRGLVWMLNAMREQLDHWIRHAKMNPMTADWGARKALNSVVQGLLAIDPDLLVEQNFLMG